MKRLTIKLDGRNAIRLGRAYGASIEAMPDFENMHLTGNVADRLAAYEDTGLEPEAVKGIWESFIGEISAEIAEEQGYVEVNRAKEIACAEVEGRLVIPPCKLGDTVWVLHTGFNTNFLHVYEGRCIEISQSLFHGATSESYTIDVIDFDVVFYGHDIGSTMFFSRSEAEAALKKRKEENHGTTD